MRLSYKDWIPACAGMTMKNISPHTRRTIGLLGGSFNPAHGGHLHITLYALKKLGLDEVWWLVSPHNPLKTSSELAEYEKRLASARALAVPHRRIRVLDLEAKEHLRYSFQTIDWLQRHFPAARFVWLMVLLCRCCTL